MERETIRDESLESEARDAQAPATAHIPCVVYSYLVDAKGQDRFLFVSDRVREWFGVEPHAALEDIDLVWARIDPHDLERVREAITAAVRTDATFAFDFRISDARGRTRWVRSTGDPEPRRADGSMVFHGVMLDTTEHHQRAQFEAHQRTILEKLARGAPLRHLLDEICRLAESQIADIQCTILLLDEKRRAVTFGAAPTMDRAYMDALEGLPIGPEAGSCGTAMYFGSQVISADIEQDPKWAPYLAVARRFSLGASWSTPFFGLRGAVAGSIAAYARAPRHPDRRELEVLATCAQLAGLTLQRDHSQRALQDAELQLHHAQKLEAVGQLAGGIAHDFNNLLTVVQGAASLLEDMLDDDSAARKEAQLVLEASERATTLTRQLLTFSRRQSWSPRSIRVVSTLQGLLPLLRRTLGQEIDLGLELGDDLPNIHIDPGQLEQVIVNLAVNARDAMPEGGRLSLRASRASSVEGAAELTIDDGGVASGGYLRLEVEDDGQGMPPAVVDRIFEPFFTTKAPGKGSGLGLATVYGIVERAQGRVRVQSTPGEGTCFEIFFPAYEGDDDERVDRSGRSSRRAREGERVLVVEDEPLVRTLAGRLLRAQGYEVHEVGGGYAALDVLEAEEGRFDLVLSDVLMPHMTGVQLAAEVEARFDIPVLLMSAYAADTHFIGAKGRVTPPMLDKPFDTAQLARAVRDAIDG